MKTDIEYIGVEQARQLLSRNTNKNRPLSQRHVDYLANAMKNGNWAINGQTIIISDVGELIDGQHRMSAIIKSGVTVPMLVCRGVEGKNFVYIDEGKSRTAANVFASMGIKDCSNMAAICNFVLTYREVMRRNIGWNLRTKFSNDEVLQEFKNNKEIYLEVKHLSKKGKAVCAQSVSGGIAAISMMDSMADRNQIVEFWDGVATGEMLTTKHPSYVLRERLISIKSNKYENPPKNYIISIAIKCWNSFFLGKEMSLVRVNASDKIPRIL